jgi:hypothetical protein
MAENSNYRQMVGGVDNKIDMETMLLSLAGICAGGPLDLADRHDYYLHTKGLCLDERNQA